jgi:hypothetical protein
MGTKLVALGVIYCRLLTLRNVDRMSAIWPKRGFTFRRTSVRQSLL